MAKIAARMASLRLKQARLSYSILVDGMLVDAQLGLRGDKKSEGNILVPRDNRSKQYKVAASHIPLSSTDSPGRRVPEEAAEFTWDSRWLSEAIRHYYRGHVIRIFL
jgi:hypothetical protein